MICARLRVCRRDVVFHPVTCWCRTIVLFGWTSHRGGRLRTSSSASTWATAWKCPIRFVRRRVSTAIRAARTKSMSVTRALAATARHRRADGVASRLCGAIIDEGGDASLPSPWLFEIADTLGGRLTNEVPTLSRVLVARRWPERTTGGASCRERPDAGKVTAAGYSRRRADRHAVGAPALLSAVSYRYRCRQLRHRSCRRPCRRCHRQCPHRCRHRHRPARARSIRAS